MFKKTLLSILLTILFIPTFVLAYSDHLILGGENIGIELKSKGVVVVGFYKEESIMIKKKTVPQRRYALSNKQREDLKKHGTILIDLKDGETEKRIVEKDIDCYKRGLFVKPSAKRKRYGGTQRPIKCCESQRQPKPAGTIKGGSRKVTSEGDEE